MISFMTNLLCSLGCARKKASPMPTVFQAKTTMDISNFVSQNVKTGSNMPISWKNKICHPTRQQNNIQRLHWGCRPIHFAASFTQDKVIFPFYILRTQSSAYPSAGRHGPFGKGFCNDWRRWKWWREWNSCGSKTIQWPRCFFKPPQSSVWNIRQL